MILVLMGLVKLHVQLFFYPALCNLQQRLVIVLLLADERAQVAFPSVHIALAFRELRQAFDGFFHGVKDVNLK